MDRLSRQKVSNYCPYDILDQMDLAATHGTFHPKATFFSSAQGTLLRIEHILGQKTSLNKFDIY